MKKPDTMVPDSSHLTDRNFQQAAVAAIYAKLNQHTQEEIINERNSLALEGPIESQNELALRRNEYPSDPVKDASDEVRFACLLAFSEVALSFRSQLLRSDAPKKLTVAESGVAFRREGRTVSIPRAYFISRIGDRAVLHWELAHAMYMAIHEALLDGSLKLDDDLRSTINTADRTATLHLA